MLASAVFVVEARGESVNMFRICKGIILMAAVACALDFPAHGQDSQSLGDVARQARQQKQNKDAQYKTGKLAAPSKVITNEELPSRPESSSDSAGANGNGSSDSSVSSSGAAKLPAEQWTSQIKAQKTAVESLTANIDKLNDSIQFAGTNCVSGCAQWNEHQKQKQQEVERMRTQLESEKKRLQDMQESARQQGYGSSVYDP